MTEVVPFPVVALSESSEGWGCRIPPFAKCARPSDSAQAGFGVRFAPSLRDSVPFLAAYPGLTSWAIICRPSGAQVFAASASLPSWGSDLLRLVARLKSCPSRSWSFPNPQRMGLWNPTLRKVREEWATLRAEARFLFGRFTRRLSAALPRYCTSSGRSA